MFRKELSVEDKFKSYLRPKPTLYFSSLPFHKRVTNIEHPFPHPVIDQFMWKLKENRNPPTDPILDW